MENMRKLHPFKISPFLITLLFGYFLLWLLEYCWVNLDLPQAKHCKKEHLSVSVFVRYQPLLIPYFAFSQR